MDFRQCPACQASVLDDDATECPFCGASMSGKPSAAPAKAPAAKAPAAKAAAAKAPAAKPAAQVPAKADPVKRQTPPRKVGETVADEDDPFGVDTSAIAQVPKVAPKPAKGRSIRVVCPMCETPGFISPKMHGKDVKCCNEQCRFPVFKAPLPEKKDVESDTRKGGLSGKAVGIAAGVVLVLGGLLSWGFYFSRQPSGGAEQIGLDKPSPNVPGDNGPPVADIGGSEVRPRAPQVTLAEIKRQALAQIVTAAQVRDENSKPYGRRLAAEAHALAGNLKEAQQQLGHLKSVGRSVPFFQVEPLVIIAWDQLQRGDTAAATQTLQQAVEAYRDLTQVGRHVLTAGISLAGAQVAFGQIPQARTTLRQLEAEPERARIAALLEIVVHLQTYDVDELLHYTSLDLAMDPLAVAVGTDVASHGVWEPALAWAKVQSNADVREDVLSALAAFAARYSVQTGDGAPLELLLTTADLTPTGLARIRAGEAAGYLMLGNQPQAEEALAKAIEAFETIPKPTPVADPGVKEIHNSDGKANAGLPNAAPLRSAAVAAAQIARLQVLMGQSEAGWASLLKAWDFTAGIAPGYGAITQLNTELEKNRTRTEARLKRELNLRNPDEEYRGMNQYRRQLRYFDNAATARFHLERTLLRNAAEWGLGADVAKLRENPGAVVPTAAGQPYQQADDKDQLATVFANADQSFANGRFKEAGETLAAFTGGQSSLDERCDLHVLQLACRLAKQKKLDALFDFIDVLNDAWLMEDAMELTAALCVVTGQGPEIWKQIPRRDLQPTEKVALYRGLISGVISVERQPKPTQTAAADAVP